VHACEGGTEHGRERAREGGREGGSEGTSVDVRGLVRGRAYVYLSRERGKEDKDMCECA
jgi:hypothetical protein